MKEERYRKETINELLSDSMHRYWMAKIREWTRELKNRKESKMKYKVGDKVRVRSDLVIDKEYDGISFASMMAELKGKIVTIKNYPGRYGVCHIQEDRWQWHDEMFEPINKKEVNMGSMANWNQANEKWSKKMAERISSLKDFIETRCGYCKRFNPEAIRVCKEMECPLRLNFGRKLCVEDVLDSLCNFADECDKMHQRILDTKHHFEEKKVEKTYKEGQRFRGGDGDEYMLVYTGHLFLVDVKNGHWRNRGIDIKDVHWITEEEFNEVCGASGSKYFTPIENKES